MLPFYGLRRSSEQLSHVIDRVQHYSEQCTGAVIESNAIIQWLVQTLGHRGKVGFTGVSLGGAMSALGSLFCNVPNVSIPFIPANCPVDAYVVGALSKTIDWSMFAEGKKSVYDLLRFMDIADTAASVRKNAEQENKVHLQPKRVYLQASARHDRYIPLESSTELAKQMMALPNMQYGEFTLLKGGHVSAFLFHREKYLEMINRAFEILKI
jgi:hypothetical protein